jgi:hypothetical protein
MLDEERCREMDVVAHPIVALPALLTLRSLLDAQSPASSAPGPVVSEASLSGGAHESTTPGNLSVGTPQHAGASGDSAGTMSEFEMSLLRQRAMEAHRDKVRRGLVLTQVPAGYIRTDDEGIEKTPDRQIQEAITGIFRKFRELGSIRQVMLWYREEKLLIPVLSRESGYRKVVWSEPIYPTIIGILKNPTYAGVFVWGRKQTRTAIVEGRAYKTRGHARPQEKWEVVIPDHHEGYITWEEFMRNQEQIRSNAGWNARMGQTPGAARNGPALLTGLLRCGRCGRALQVTYTNSKLHGPCRATGVAVTAAGNWFAPALPSRERA